MHRRQFLPDARVTHYDIVRFKSLAARIDARNTALIVRMIDNVKNGMSGTASYEGARAQFDAYVAHLGFFRSWRLKIEVALYRLWSWIRGRETSNYAKVQKAAA
jgi:hypothetical protein